MIKPFKPKSKALHKYIDCFYVFEQGKPINRSYIAFPHVNTGMSFFKNTEIKRGRNEVIIRTTNQKESSFTIEILGKYLNPVFVHYSGNVQEVAIVFKPLGINHFLKDPLDKITPSYSQDFNHKLWLGFAEVLFKENSVESQIAVLEEFLIQQLQEIDLTLIYKAIGYLEKPENEYPIEKIASLVNMNLKTFQRHFYKNLACSPSNYKRIAKFRHSLNARLMEKEIKKLTTIAYDSNYYDQSYFVREYKKLTTLNPKSFFNTITTLNNNTIVWKIK